MGNAFQNRDGLPPSLTEERRFFELYGPGKGDTPEGWNNPDNWKCLDDIPEDKYFGFAIGNNSSYLFIDGDHVRDPETERFVPWVVDVLKRVAAIAPTYGEDSVSGTGFHQIVDLGDLADSFEAESNSYDKIIVDMDMDKYRALSKEERDKVPKIELFYRTTGRYVYLTGKNKKVQEVARDEDAAAIFRELKKIRDEFHEKHNGTVASGAANFSIDKQTQNRVLEALPYISADCSREEWVHIGIALHHCGFDFTVWDTWSQYKSMRTGEASDKYVEGETETIWKSFHNNKSRWNAGTIISMAKRFGFQTTKEEDNAAFAELDRFDKDILSSLPPFPVDCLPEVIEGFVLDVAKCLEIAPDMVACEVLSVLGACCMGKFRIRLSPTWINQMNIYIICVGAPGDGKSASLKPCTEPLYDWIMQENEAREPDIRSSEAKIRYLEKEFSQMEQRIGKPVKGEGAAVSPEDLASKLEEIDKAKKEAVKAITMLQDDITPEALSSVMEANEEKAVIISAEGGFADVLAGRYNNGKSNLDLINKAFDSEYYSRTRVGGGQVALRRPIATLGLFVQPNVLKACLCNSEFRGRGFVSRFLYSCPKSLVGYRKMENIPADWKVREAYRELIFKLMSCSEQDLDCIKLSPEASAAFREFRLEIESKLRPGEDLEPVSDMASRIAGNTGRIMGILHVVKHLDTSTLETVSGDEAQKAVTIGRYFLEQMIGIVYGMDEPDEIVDAKYILNKLRDTDNRDKCDNGRVSTRELLRLCRKFKKVDDMQPGMSELERRGYIRSETKGKVRGEWIYLNPEVFE